MTTSNKFYKNLALTALHLLEAGYVAEASAILEARKAQPLSGEIVAKKVREMVLSYFLTEEMYEKYLPEEWKNTLPYKRWKRANENAIRGSADFHKSVNLVFVSTSSFLYTGALFFEDPEVFRKFNKRLEKVSKGWGWYILKRNLPTSPKDIYSADLAPNYGDLVTDLPQKLYHLALKENLPSIQRKGLIPRKGRQHGVSLRGYPDRIYFARSMNVIVDLHEGFLSWNPDEEGKYVVISVDPRKLRKGTKFYNDPEMPHGYGMWTYTHVPKEAILGIEDLD